MLILAKSILSITLGLVIAIVTGLIVLPFLRKLNARQTVSKLINKRHLLKNGTPTLGGLIFIIPPLLIVLLLGIRGSLEMNSNLLIILLVFVAYGLLGFIDDYKKIKEHNNKGLPTDLEIQIFLRKSLELRESPCLALSIIVRIDMQL